MEISHYLSPKAKFDCSVLNIHHFHTFKLIIDLMKIVEFAYEINQLPLSPFILSIIQNFHRHLNILSVFNDGPRKKFELKNIYLTKSFSH